MYSITGNGMTRHYASMQRLIWMAMPTFSTRFRALAEYVRLARLQRRLLKPGGLQRELEGVLSDPRTTQREIDVDEVYGHLQPLAAAVHVHKAALCLARSIRILQVLRARGIAKGARLRIGLRCAPIGFRGHAWVEHTDWPLLDTPQPDNVYDTIWDADEIFREICPTTQRPNAPAACPNGTHGDLRPAAGTIVTRVASGEAVLLDLTSGHCYELNETAWQVWQEIAGRGMIFGAIDRIVNTTGEAPETVRTDVLQLVEELRGVGLLTSY